MSDLDRDYLEGRLRRHGEMYGCIQCYRHPTDPCQEKRQLLAAGRWLALTETGPDYEAAYREVAVAWNKNTVTHKVMFDAAVAAVDAALADYLTEEETK